MAYRSLTLFSACSVFVALFIVGCGDGSGEDETASPATSNQAPVGQVSSAVTVASRECPDAHSAHAPEFYQAEATRVARYLLGGPDAFAPMHGSLYEADMSNPQCVAAKTCIDALKSSIEQRYITVGSSGMNMACGLRAGLITLTAARGISPSDIATMAQCASNLDGCWGVGVSGFFYPDPLGFTPNSSLSDDKIYIDPEPARLTAPLSGSTGATAAAVFVNTSTSTNVVKWTSGYMSAAWVPAAGTPCSIGDLPAGVDATQMIQAAGGYRRCF